MRFTSTLLTIICLLSLLCVAPMTWARAAATEEQVLDQSLLTAGEWKYETGKITIAGLIYTGYGRPYANHGYYPDNSAATFNISGWERLVAHVGLADDFEKIGPQKASIEVDGKMMWKAQMLVGQKANDVAIDVTGKKTLTLRWQAGTTFFAEVKLTRKSAPAAREALPTEHPNLPADTAMAPTAPANDVTLDATDIEALAVALRKRVDTRPELKSRVANSSIALLKFQLLDLPASSLAGKVAEDFCTALINHDFPLVERGQLERAMVELHLRDESVIDNATARKLGKLSGCDLLLVGSISNNGQSVVINTRLLDVATGKALIAERIEARKIQALHTGTGKN